MIEAPRRAESAMLQPGQPPSKALRASTDRAAADGGLDHRLQRRLWLTVCCLLLVVLAFVDRPGNIIADTKLDLAVNPVGFLERALHLWDPSQFGQLQDQAAGYLFPVGPFFVAGKFLALQPWVAQRLWIAAVAITAFLGTVRLCARLGVGTPSSRIMAGFAYALAPRGLALLGVLSGEFLPAAMLPWILLPLVRAMQAGDTMGTAGRIRAAARSAVAVALCSGVNATSIVAVLVGATIYLVTAPRRARAWRIFACWAPAVVLATLWWLYPLVLLGKYGVSFLPYTESAAITTSTTSLSNTLRGTEDWVNYLFVNGSPWWPIGSRLANQMVPTILTGLVAGLGLTGLLRRDVPARRYLLSSALLGVLVILTGHVSGLGNPLAHQLDYLLNGPLAPLRNLRKFDPLIRLPVALGLAHLLASVGHPSWRKAVSLIAAAAMAVLVVPAFTSGLSTPGDFRAIPQYWVRAAGWLSKHATNQAVLAVPGARFGEYVWGRPMDDVLEALFKGDWASRQSGTIGSVGNTRLLDAIDERIAAGQGSAGLTEILARMGVKYIVVRNDLIRADLRGAWPARIHQALSESPGIVRVARFGSQPVGSFFPDDAVGSVDTPYSPVEIYQVTGAEPAVTVQPAAGTIRVYGGPEALLTMADARLLPDGPVLLDSDGHGLPASYSVVTDSLRRRIRDFGELRVDYSPTLTAGDPARTFAVADDYTEPAWRRYQSVARYYGITNVTASSSAAGMNALAAQSSTGRLPYAAVDGDLRTMWESGSLAGPVGQWIKLSFDQPVDTNVIYVAFVQNPFVGPPVTRITVSTNAGTLTEPVRPSADIQAVRIPAGPAAWLRITIAGTSLPGVPGTQVGIATISVPGITPSRTIVAPDVTMPGGGNPAAYVLSKAEPSQSDCMLTSLRWVCSPLLAKTTEEQYGFDHSFTAASAEPMQLAGAVTVADPALAEHYAWLGPHQPAVRASSVYTPDPQDQAQAAFDGDPWTTWVASGADKMPSLRIRWGRARTISQVTISRPPGAAAPALLQVTGAHGQSREGWIVQPTATLRFAAMRTRSIVLTFTPSTLPLQVTDVTIPGVRPLRAAALPFRLSCGLGPFLQLNGTTIPTHVWGSFSALLTGRPLRFAACKPVSVVAGLNRVLEPGWDAFDIQSVSLARSGLKIQPAATASSPQPVSVLRWGPADRVVRVWAGQRSYLVVDQNFNKGWQATYGKQTLRPVRLDGWRQGWVLPAGTSGAVTLTYTPDVRYRLSLAGGLAALTVIMLIAIGPVWRRRTAIASDPADDASSQVLHPSRSSPRAALRSGLAAIIVLAMCGLWVAGYPGMLIVPAAAGVFALAQRLPRLTALRVLASPWLALGLLGTASALTVVGQHLAQGGQGGSIVKLASDSGPQLLCLIIVARLMASLLESGPSPNTGEGAKPTSRWR